VLFETAVDAYGTALIGVILTGSNQDGALGLTAIAKAGGIALVQDPELAFQDAMPQATIDADPTANVLSLALITACLQKV
jgi:two-component system chemotaxis response regulator CheB